VPYASYRYFDWGVFIRQNDAVFVHDYSIQCQVRGVKTPVPQGPRLAGPALFHPAQLLISGVGVEKLEISENQYKFGDRKCLGNLNKSFVGHLDTIYFLRIFAK
jgi:hypothetical protein